MGDLLLAAGLAPQFLGQAPQPFSDAAGDEGAAAAGVEGLGVRPDVAEQLLDVGIGQLGQRNDAARPEAAVAAAGLGVEPVPDVEAVADVADDQEGRGRGLQGQGHGIAGALGEGQLKPGVIGGAGMVPTRGGLLHQPRQPGRVDAGLLPFPPTATDAGFALGPQFVRRALGFQDEAPGLVEIHVVLGELAFRRVVRDPPFEAVPGGGAGGLRRGQVQYLDQLGEEELHVAAFRAAGGLPAGDEGRDGQGHGTHLGMTLWSGDVSGLG